MRFTDLTFEKIEKFDPYNSRAKANGFVTEWVARNQYGNAVAFGYTKTECMKDAINYLRTIEK